MKRDVLLSNADHRHWSLSSLQVLFRINLLFHLIICPPPLVVCPIHSKYARGTMNECYRRNIMEANIKYGFEDGFD